MTIDKRNKIIAWAVVGISIIAAWFICQEIIFPWYFGSVIFGPNLFK
jgi:hypothetical protein